VKTQIKNHIRSVLNEDSDYVHDVLQDVLDDDDYATDYDDDS
jgi:hypothetical protein